MERGLQTGRTRIDQHGIAGPHQGRGHQADRFFCGAPVGRAFVEGHLTAKPDRI
jgi:hypothetical protein